MVEQGGAQTKTEISSNQRCQQGALQPDRDIWIDIVNKKDDGRLPSTNAIVAMFSDTLRGVVSGLMPRLVDAAGSQPQTV